MKDGIAESAKVVAVGGTGFFASLSLTDVSVLVSICVGVATLIYIITKTYFLIRNKGRSE